MRRADSNPVLTSSDETLASQECLEIARAVNGPQDFHAIEQREIEDENPFEIRYPKHPQALEISVSESSMPPHLGLGGKKNKGVVGRYEKTVADFGTGDGGVIVRLILKILVCFGSDDVPAFAHRMPVFFRRSSRRRCCSSQ